jgi:hypothetical protein
MLRKKQVDGNILINQDSYLEFQYNLIMNKLFDQKIIEFPVFDCNKKED